MPESFVAAKRMGALEGFELDVICGEPPPGWAREDDHSLDAYVAERFSHVTRVSRSSIWDHVRLTRYEPLIRPPDPFRLLNGPARRAAMRAIRTRRYSAIFTCSQLHSIHLVGLALKKRFRLPWLAHFSDPWVRNPFLSMTPLERRLNARLERRVMSTADRLLFTSRQAVDLSLEGYPESWRSKVRVLPHPYDPRLFPARTLSSADESVVLRYMGSFYGRRTPEPLVRALSQLAVDDPSLLLRLRVEIVGDAGPGLLADGAGALPPGVLTVLPRVDYVPSLELMADADGLLVVDAPGTTSPFLPSKLVDYVGAGRPIAALTPEGPAADLTRRLGGPVADPTDARACAEALRAVARLAQDFRTEPFGDPDVRREYTTETVGAQLAEIVGDVVAPASGVDDSLRARAS